MSNLTPGPGFERVWRFRAAPGREAEFERVYGSTGDWGRLFGQAPGYLGTDLQRVNADPAEYLVADRWESRAAWEAFRRNHAAAYESLDRQCEVLTAAETLVRETDSSGAGERERRGG